MICKSCKRNTHYCMNCGVEDWYEDYCSEQCLAADGKKPCPTCHGWGVDGHEYPDDFEGDYCHGFVEATDDS